VEFRLLGPFEISHDGRPLTVGTPQMRALLAVLLLRGGRATVDQLIAELWPHGTATDARAMVHSYVSRLRRVLTPSGAAAVDQVRLLTRPSGYELVVRPGELDLHRFDDMVAQARTARQAGQLTACATLLRQALGLWRGAALADLPDTPTLVAEAARLTECRLTEYEELFDADLAAGHGGDLVPELATLCAEHPLRERFTGQLILALYRGGRQSEALAAYQRLRAGLSDALGIDPSPELQALHAAVLRQDPGLGGPPAAGAGPDGGPGPGGRPVPGAVGRPAQLPPAVHGFTGRYDSLAELDALLETADGPAVVTIAAITGTGGVGKTALALHWSHRVLDRFPDGQLYVNLRGYDPGEPLPAASALEGFLRALGTEPSKVPARLDERAAAYRSAVSGRRMLVVLDNARTAEQVRPLVPGTSGCLVLVTSRNDLAGLVARDGAHRLALPRLPGAEAAELLRQILRPARTDHAATAIAELVRLCAGLPLALRVVAERAARRPDVPLADLIAELSERTERLNLLSPADDPHAAVRTVLSWSHDALPPAAARLLRLLGLHPGHDLDRYAAAQLAAVGLAEAGRLLDALLGGFLIEPIGTGRYQMHDLLRAYAAERAETEESDSDRRAALTRVFEHYLRTAAAAMDLVAPHERYRRPTIAAPTDPVVPLTTAAEALAWLDAERRNLVAVAGYAADDGWPTYATRLSTVLWRYLNMGAHYTDAEALHGHALRAAEEAGDPAAYADALIDLAVGYERQGRYDEAIDHLDRALATAGAAGHHFGEFRALNSLGIVHGQLGHGERSLELHHRALALARDRHDRAGEAALLGNLGVTYEGLGRYDEARRHGEQALELAREVGHRNMEAAALINLGAVLQALGDHRLAVDRYRESRTLAREIGNRGIETASLIGIGTACRLAGQPAAALEQYGRALVLAGEIGERHKEAEALAGIGHVLHGSASTAGQAREHWRRALAIFTDLGAAAEAAQMEACLADAGPTGPPTEVAHRSAH
jgi:DNA-binding SARP family transcriptional activator/tetratricopeptide (TPR) repeat protein